MDRRSSEDGITITEDNLDDWPEFRKMYDAGKVAFDSAGRLRYPHGAPVGVMVQTGIDRNGHPVFRELADEWFDPGSPAARSFEWPQKP